MKDKQGREYAKADDLSTGATIELDGDFTCRHAGKVEVKEDEVGLYFECTEGKHYLSGQLNDDGSLMGIYLISRGQP